MINKTVIKLLIGLITGIVIAVCVKKCSVSHLEFVLNTIITCVSTITGFILTSISILIGLSSNCLLKYLQQNGSMKELKYRYSESLIIGLIILIICIVFGCNLDDKNTVNSWWIVSGITLLISYLISIVFSGYFLLSIISKLQDAEDFTNRNKPTVPPGEFKV